MTAGGTSQLGVRRGLLTVAGLDQTNSTFEPSIPAIVITGDGADSVTDAVRVLLLVQAEKS